MGLKLAIGSLAVGLASGCVITTYEGQGEPPRSPAPPLYEPTSPSEGSPSTGAAPAEDEPESIAASHILIQYRGSMRAPPDVIRSKEEARERAADVLARARAGEDFAELAAEYSEEPGAAERGGALGRFPRSAMVKPFADAAFALEPGGVSEVVETVFGFHIIKRTE